MHLSPRTGWIVVVLLVLALVLIGCAKKAAAPTGPPGGVKPAPQAGTPAVPGGGEAPAGELETLADVWKGINTKDSYAMTLTTSDGETMTQLIKLEDGKPVKMKMDDPGGEGSMIIDLTEQAMYMYSPGENQALKMTMGGETAGDEQEMMAAATLGPDSVGSDVELDVTETLDGEECWVVETTTKSDKGEEQAKIWVSKALGLPVQMEAGGNTIKMSYSRFNEVADSEFDLPEDVEIIDMAKMFEQMGEKPGGPGAEKGP